MQCDCYVLCTCLPVKPLNIDDEAVYGFEVECLKSYFTRKPNESKRQHFACLAELKKEYPWFVQGSWMAKIDSTGHKIVWTICELDSQIGQTHLVVWINNDFLYDSVVQIEIQNNLRKPGQEPTW
jgi:hypothetical protein